MRSVASVDDGNLFTIDSEGRLSINQPPDLADADSGVEYAVEVKVISDGILPNESTATITVTVVHESAISAGGFHSCAVVEWCGDVLGYE